MKGTESINKKKKLSERYLSYTIAFHLLNGPRSIIPTNQKKRYGWLESVLTIKRYPLGIDKPCYSYSVYVDNTVNKDHGFLDPIARMAVWDRPKELESKTVHTWPEVQIIQHELNQLEQKKLDNQLKLLDSRISSLQFAVGGLITDRGDPTPIDVNAGSRNLIMNRWNGCQTIEFFFGDSNRMNIELEKVLVEIISYIEEICRNPIDKPYRERYDENLKMLSTSVNYTSYWDYRPPKAKQ